MSAMSDFFRFRTGVVNIETGVASPYRLGIACDYFVKNDVLNIYEKILKDVIERTHGIPPEFAVSLWDNCMGNQSQKGLISLLACAMEQMSDLFLVYKNGVLREADVFEKAKIKNDYETKGVSKVGIFVSFKNYRRTELLKIYSAFEYCVLNALNKGLSLASAIQFKMNEMRSSVGENSKATIVTEARKVAQALGVGQDVIMDGKDIIETAQVDVVPIEKAISFLDGKRSFILGLPVSYINGEQTTGIGSTGESDAKAIERGLKEYYVSIVQPVLLAFGYKTSFKSDNFRQMSSALEALKTFAIVDDELLSKENKVMIINKLFDLDDSSEA